MNWDALKTYNLGYRSAFETLNNQLFERYMRRTHGSSMIGFRVVNGSGGDGGIEAYAELANNDLIAIQSKWFRHSLEDAEIRQIKNSILTAKKVRPQIKQYIICVPHNVNSQKIGRGNKLTTNDEEKRINGLINEIQQLHGDLTLTWWFDNELLSEIQHSDNEGVHRYWFDKEVITLSYLKDQFTIQKQNNWLKERYISSLHGSGIIFKQYQKMILAKEFREELSEMLMTTINKLERGQRLIVNFIDTNEYPATLAVDLQKISANLQEFINEIMCLSKAINTGNDLFRANTLTEENIWPVMIELENLPPTHRQKQILPQLINCLRDIHIYSLTEYITDFNKHFIERIKLVRGTAGTGKTHGLAHCTETHLENDLPALIIRAKDTPCSNWTELLTHSLELHGWTKDEIFSALESVAVSRDISVAKSLNNDETLQEPSSKVLICIDGLEEETGKEQQWCDRIAETTVYAEKYPRIRFLFSARDYFLSKCIDTYHEIWEELDLPREGDVSIWEVAENYLNTYDIEVSNLALIKGLDSLLALRLFCEQYRGRKISSSTQIVTATRDLLGLKVARINAEFLNSLQQRKAIVQQPVFEALVLIAELFYHKAEIEHTLIREAIVKKIGSSLDTSEVELMLDFFVQHGILIRTSREDSSDVLPVVHHFYQITYQSIIEHILSEKIYREIKEGGMNAIPDILHKGIARPLHVRQKFNPFETPLNHQIIHSIINRLFADTGKLIGENGYLTAGFSEQDIIQMQLEAIGSAPNERACTYKGKIDQMFFGDAKGQYMVLKYLIVPSCRNADSVFGAEYLHDILMRQESAFERDKLWSGLDDFEKSEQEFDIYHNNAKAAIDVYGIAVLVLSEYVTYNETPLLFAWALTNIDQSFRTALRVALTGWAIKRPLEFIKLLEKVFDCNDPQLQEDLASVMLGVASHTNAVDHLKRLAEWSLKNIFENREHHRNVVVRQGFRSIVEKAFYAGSIDESEVVKARPVEMQKVQLIILEKDLAMDLDGGSYPIVKDLAWYVIKRSYADFLEYPFQMETELKDKDCLEAKTLLDHYRKIYELPEIFASTWAMRAAVAFIRKVLGLTRTTGNTWTDETHGIKSKIYTYEEKYTWLAVHYLQGYLSDYIPMKSGDGSRKWIEDYSKITDIPNPGEEIMTDKKIDRLIERNSNWVIKEDLAGTISVSGNVNENITSWVKDEPKIDFSNWLNYDEKDFPEQGAGKNWLALYHHANLHDASNAGYSKFHGIACIIKEGEFENFKVALKNKDDGQTYFISHLDSLTASPDTATYSNPSDIVWMDWVAEASDGEIIHFAPGSVESKLLYTITELTQGTVEGEKHYRLPSKLVRKLIGIRSFFQSEMTNADDETVSFIHKKSEEDHHDKQEIVLVGKQLLEEKLKEQNLMIVWLTDVFKQKNPLNEVLDKNFHSQKSRKYLVWQEDNEFKSIKIWDEYFSNQRDNATKQADAG